MPCATLHVLVHLIPKQMQLERFPAIYTIKYSNADAPEHYTLSAMIVWATLPYAIWQLSYHFLITVRKRTKIAAGRPTSFTWLRRSYRGNFLGRFVLSFPDQVQEPIFMGIQYVYALLTMLPCPIWFWYRWASATFMMVVLAWASWNGATYYIDVFGKRMEKELSELRKQVERMSKSPEMKGDDGATPVASPDGPQGMVKGIDGTVGPESRTSALDIGPAFADDGPHRRHKSVDEIPMLDGSTAHVQTPSEPPTPGVEMKNVRFSDSNAERSADGQERANGVEVDKEERETSKDK